MEGITELTKKERLASVPVNEIADYLKRHDYIVVGPHEKVHDHSDIEDRIRDEGYAIVDSTEYTPDDERDKIEIRLTGSIVDEDIKEAIQGLYDKHNYSLPNTLRQLL